MKKIGLLIVLMISLVSCSNDSEDSLQTANSDYYGKWVNTHEVKDVNSAFLWTENYVFNKDNTFTKTRTTKDGTITASGTFQVVILDNNPSLDLTYRSSTNLVYSCSTGVGGTKELLYLFEGKLRSGASMCDAGGTYEKAK
ncbi:hypothetical protein K6T82_10560 [Flavobacterium sp. 17A]|uniref:Lipocalin-like domain-containing protein n=1 Tax=Flavobacterium potami TaxID=2872310 RepID=A0A9X1KRG5_9FLAO|nr:hypothetical protein [Flavobacterium potami]MBZ4035211.1 hypothetical protein [Flavobacterium potami]